MPVYSRYNIITGTTLAFAWRCWENPWNTHQIIRSPNRDLNAELLKYETALSKLQLPSGFDLGVSKNTDYMKIYKEMLQYIWLGKSKHLQWPSQDTNQTPSGYKHNHPPSSRRHQVLPKRRHTSTRLQHHISEDNYMHNNRCEHLIYL
jgi:hypothetical protein